MTRLSGSTAFVAKSHLTVTFLRALVDGCVFIVVVVILGALGAKRSAVARVLSWSRADLNESRHNVGHLLRVVRLPLDVANREA